MTDGQDAGAIEMAERIIATGPRRSPSLPRSGDGGRSWRALQS
ncbi:hypothetical protein L332_06045 [Agrococcus pavilionensis RW1]|uniref:Uncharacterized protein n=1 Tax=Agrococcus pavilionensis RW1 TaxID=1330458 RepID=U1MTL7_9MICO|nr:hypothetical protein L332_06045 [Agrococcus pavilionensis RW1]